jgi:hypothetical protein
VTCWEDSPGQTPLSLYAMPSPSVPYPSATPSAAIAVAAGRDSMIEIQKSVGALLSPCVKSKILGKINCMR